jgi:hypothetical protein
MFNSYVSLPEGNNFIPEQRNGFENMAMVI